MVLVWADVARAEDGVLDDNNVRGGFADLGSLVRDFALVPDVCVVVDSRILRSQTVMDRRGAIEKSVIHRDEIAHGWLGRSARNDVSSVEDSLKKAIAT